MAKKSNKTEDQFAQVEGALTKTEQFIEDNQDKLVKIVGAFVAVACLFLGYQNFYLEPMEKEAQTEMFNAEIYFAKDSFNLALNGDNQYLGFLDIADDFTYKDRKNFTLNHFLERINIYNEEEFDYEIDRIRI